jgi:transcriptional regulator with XRE-family HTH domain
MTRPDIHDRLAARLKEARSAKGLSLDAVARLSGVSRSMVSQIERGESSPTVATLWNLTRALQVDLAGLLDGAPAPGIDVVLAAEAPTITGLGRGCRIRILSAPDQVGRHEVYELAFQPEGTLESEPHNPGAREQITVIEGQLRVEAAGLAETLSTGDTARYPADGPHAIRAVSGAARAFLIVENG